MSSLPTADSVLAVLMDRLLETSDPRAEVVRALITGAGVVHGKNTDGDRFWLVNERRAGGGLVSAENTVARVLISDSPARPIIAEEYGGAIYFGPREADLHVRFQILHPGYALDHAPFTAHAVGVELCTSRTERKR